MSRRTAPPADARWESPVGIDLQLVWGAVENLCEACGFDAPSSPDAVWSDPGRNEVWFRIDDVQHGRTGAILGGVYVVAEIDCDGAPDGSGTTCVSFEVIRWWPK